MSELIYQLEKDLSSESKALVIRILPAKKEGYYYQFPSQFPQLSKGFILKLATERDREILALFFEEEAQYQKNVLKKSGNESNFAYELIHIPHRKSIQALKLLAATGRFYFNQRQLACDFYGKVEFYYFVNEKGISGHLKIEGQQDMNIADCDFLCQGPPHWYIKGIFLRVIATDVSWKKLQGALSGTLRKEDVSELLEDQEEDKEAPKVIVENFHPIQQPAPYPVLKLKDRSGGFADLWMDYGSDRLVPYNEHRAQGFKRALDQEKSWEKDLLETGFIQKLVSNSHYYCPLDKVAKSLSFLLEIGWKIFDWKENRVLQHTNMDLILDSNQQLIYLRGKVHFNDYEANLSDVAGAFTRREKFIQIVPGIVGLLPTSWNQTDLGDIAAECEIVSDALVLKQDHIGALSPLFEAEVANLETTLSFQKLRTKLLTFEGVQEADPGNNFKGSLRPYQQQGLNWLASLYDLGLHGMLADDMGLGKTVQVLAFLSRLHWDKPVLIILPTSLIFNWKKEIEKFLPEVPILSHQGPTRNKEADFSLHRGIILTSYALLRIDLERFLPIEYECLVLDEAQVIKNAATQTAKAIFQLHARLRLSLTGTPIENHLLELWSHFRFLVPGLLGDESSFVNEVNAGASDFRFITRIKRKVRPFILRRKKEDVAKDLPEKIEQTVWVEMEQGQRNVYETYLSGVKSNLLKKVQVDGMGKHRIEVLESILRLRQICCHPLLAAAQVSSAENLESAKLTLLLEDLETVISEGRKALIYSQFTSMLGLISKAFREKGWKFAYLDGQTTRREEVVNQFQTDAEIPFFLISLKAGGVGLNLTAADYVFLFDPWWNDAAENQAIDRAHRIGRKDTVIAKRFVTVETIEEKMMKLKAIKKTLADSIFNDDFTEGSLTEDDFLFLLN